MHSSSNDYNRLKAEWADCKACPAHATRRQVVFGRGPIPAKVMVVGQWPGFGEDIDGKPFVGPTSEYMFWALRIAGIPLEEVFYDNIISCRHPNPKVDFKISCWPRLTGTISIVSPGIIVAVGDKASKWLSSTNATMKELSMTSRVITIFDKNYIVYFATHPAEIPRLEDSPDEAEASEQKIAIEFRHLGRLVRELELYPAVEE